jgi:P pilus assembly chaperone PapD
MPNQPNKKASQYFLTPLSLLTLLCFLFVFPVTNVSANMVLSEAILHFEPGKPLRKDIEVENVGDETLYIQIDPQVVRNPGTDEESRDAYTDPRDAGLLVTPNKLIIPPKSRKLVRFVVLKPASDKEDSVYRVTFKPISNPDVPKDGQIGVKVVIAYQVLVLVQPSNPEPKLVAKRNGNKLLFINNGNTNVLLREGRQCPNKSSAEDECQTLPGQRIYAGNKWSVDLPSNKPVEYYLSIGTKNSVETY